MNLVFLLTNGEKRKITLEHFSGRTLETLKDAERSAKENVNGYTILGETGNAKETLFFLFLLFAQTLQGFLP